MCVDFLAAACLNYLEVDNMIKSLPQQKTFNHRHHDLVILPEIIDVTN